MAEKKIAENQIEELSGDGADESPTKLVVVEKVGGDTPELIQMTNIGKNLVPIRKDVGAIPSDRILFDGPTRIDKRAAILASFVDDIKLPRRWGSIQQWENLVKKEIKHLQETYGEEAFKDLCKKTNDPNARGAQLVRKYKPGERESTVELSKEAEEALLEKAGLRGFRRVFMDPDKIRREYLMKRFRAGSGHIEVRLSWYGHAWPLVDEGRLKAKEDLEAYKKENEYVLFEKLTPEEQEILDRRLGWLGHIEDARYVMSYILNVFGRDGENPVHIPAGELRILLQCERAKNGFNRVHGCLRALQEVRFYLSLSGIGGPGLQSYGPFLGEVAYKPRGPGDHTDGDFYLQIAPRFEGCLKVFCTGRYRLRDARRVLTYEWGKKLAKADKEELGDGFLKGFSALAPFYDRAKGFTSEQTRLRQWLESEITFRRDGAAHGRKAVRLKYTAPDANKPRLYGREFCPLLPEEKEFHGALGHFSKNAETGRKLYGTATAPTKTSGPRTEGLLQVMGYSLPPGQARAGRDRIVKKALQDMRAVVEEALGGVIAARHKSCWLALADAIKLREEEILKKVSWCFFVPPDWGEKLARDLEAYHADRHARGETPSLVKVTTNRSTYERAAAERRGERFGNADAVGLDGEPLHIRLHAKRKELGLSQEVVGQHFGVSQRAVAFWEIGPAPGEDGMVRGKPIPFKLVPFMVRWIETGQPPSVEELAARKTAQTGKVNCLLFRG